jgi:hypothetical protein
MAWRLVSVLSAESTSLCSGGQKVQEQVILGVSILLSDVAACYMYCSAY